jgi:DNA-binding GntR family transcriptional regulator
MPASNTTRASSAMGTSDAIQPSDAARALDAPRDGGTLRDRAYVSFTRRLLASDIRPGQFVSQRELVKLTGLPLGAIRELVPRLEAEGLIKTVPQRGMQIAHVDLSLVRDAFQFRLILEREAAGAYAVRASDAELARWRSAHEDMVRRAGRGVAKKPTDKLIDEAQALDDGFHVAVIDALNNAIISKAYRVNAIKIRLIRQSLTRLDDELVVPVMREHIGLIDALEQRDQEKAAAAFARHIAHARDRALGVC